MRNLIGYTCVICLLVTCPVCAQDQAKRTIQKLLPATVAVELKQTETSSKQQAAAPNQPYSTQAQANPYDVTIFNPSGVTPVDAVTYASGTVVSDNGLIVTMLGEVEKGDLTVVFKDGKKEKAAIVVDDRRSGLQLIKVPEVGKVAMPLSSANVEVGEAIASVVCSDLQDRSAALGIVAATSRSIDGVSIPLIQTDINIGLMSAGAPVANLNGELVGIWMGKRDDSNGVSFAVPIRFVKQLLKAHDKDQKKLERGYLGIQLNHPDGDTATIEKVVPESAAAEIGLQKGDIIVSIDAKPVDKPTDVVKLIGQYLANDEVELEIERDGDKKELTVILQAFPHFQRPDVQLGSVEVPVPSFYGIDKSGNLKLYGLQAGQPVPISETKPKLELEEEELKELLKYYERTMEAQTEIGSILGQATVRVQRSDVDKKLGELTDRVVSLQDEVEKLTKELKQLRESLAEEN